MKKIFLKKLVQNLVFEKICKKFEKTLCNINLSLYDLYVHEYTLY